MRVAYTVQAKIDCYVGLSAPPCFTPTQVDTCMKKVYYNTVDTFLDLIWTMLAHVAYPEGAKVVVLSTHFCQRLNFRAVPPGLVSLFTGGL